MPRTNRGQSNGVSMAKGPVGLLGLIGVLYGIGALIFGGHGFALHVPHGTVSGKTWLTRPRDDGHEPVHGGGAQTR